jgi:multidrug efflux pump subunit AcrA (membrane-fusion protein)
MRTRRRWLRWFFVAVLFVATALLAWFFFHKKPVEPPKPQPVSVTVAKVSAEDVPVSITTLGAAQAWTSDIVLAQVSGILLTVDFVEGTNVKKGQLLADLEQRPPITLSPLSSSQITVFYRASKAGISQNSTRLEDYVSPVIVDIR